MRIPNGSLCLFLKFRDSLKRIDVFAWGANRFDDPPLRSMGTVEGEEALEDLLDAVGIDRLLVISDLLYAVGIDGLPVTSGDAYTPNFACTAYASSPKRIVEDLKEEFAKDDEIPLKRIGDEKLSDDEKSFRPPQRLDVCASTVQMEQGAEIAAAWFKKRVIHCTTQPSMPRNESNSSSAYGPSAP